MHVDPVQAVQVLQYRLELWLGYDSGILKFEKGPVYQGGIFSIPNPMWCCKVDCFCDVMSSVVAGMIRVWKRNDNLSFVLPSLCTDNNNPVN